VVAFIVLTERLECAFIRWAAPRGAVLIPVTGSLPWLPALPLFSQCSGSACPRPRRAVCAGWIHLAAHRSGQVFCTATTLASGIPLAAKGRRCSWRGIGSVLGRALGLSPEKVKALIPVGAAAAIAAAFNTPMAAVLFALEEVMGDLNAPVLGRGAGLGYLMGNVAAAVGQQPAFSSAAV